MPDVNPRLVRAFYLAFLYHKHLVDNEGWVWTSNLIREVARAKYGAQFTNTLSPQIYRELRRKHPEVIPYLDIKPLKDRRRETPFSRDLFDHDY